MIYKSTALLLALAITNVCWAQNATSDFCYWTTVDGKQSSVRLRLIFKDSVNVRLKREDNESEISLPIERLSQQDRQHLLTRGTPSQTNLGSVNHDDWPSFRGPNRNGISDAKLELIDEPKEVWRFEERGALYCLDALTGELI